MKARFLAAASMLAVTAVTAQAQATSCPAGGDPNTIGGARANIVRDACVMGSDVFQLLGPQLGLALAGGNATLGQGGTLGGFPHFAIGVRGNVFAGDVPEFTDFPTPRNEQNPPARTLASKNQVLGMPVLDAAIGIFKGLPLGLTNVGGVDLLINATFVPEIGSEEDDFHLAPDNPIKLGFGARVGLLQESLLAPGVSVSYIQRNLPTTSIFGRSDPLDLDIADASLKTHAWRVVVSKSLLLFGLAAGVGQDRYDLETSISGVARSTVNVGGVNVPVTESFGPIDLAQKMTRTNMFLDASMNLPFLKLVGEVGRVSGGEVTDMVNDFSSGEANAPRVYGSVGFRFGF